MILLLRSLSSCHPDWFRQWLLVQARMSLHGSAQSAAAAVTRRTARRAVLSAAGKDENGRICQQIEIGLYRPAGFPAPGKTPADCPAPRPALPLVWRHTFYPAAIQDYLRRSGDTNPIHGGPRPVVPGLCLIEALYRPLALPALDWRISFLSPVYGGDTVYFYQDGTVIQGYVRSVPVVSVSAV